MSSTPPAPHEAPPLTDPTLTDPTLTNPPHANPPHADLPRADPPRRDPVDAIIGQWATVRPDLDTAAMEVFGRIFRLTRAMGDRLEKVYARFGIARGEFDVLATLRRSGEPYTLSPRELSATLMLTTGGMTGRLDKLERAGLLRRSPDPHDRRGLQVTLTERGFTLVDQAVTAGLAEQTTALDSLDPDQSDQLSDLLRQLLTATTAPTETPNQAT